MSKPTPSHLPHTICTPPSAYSRLHPANCPTTMGPSQLVPNSCIMAAVHRQRPGTQQLARNSCHLAGCPLKEGYMSWRPRSYPILHAYSSACLLIYQIDRCRWRRQRIPSNDTSTLFLSSDGIYQKIVTYQMEHSHLMEQKGTLEHEQMRRKRILYS